MFVKIGATSVSLIIKVMDDDGLPATGLVAATFPATAYLLKGDSSAVAISLVDLIFPYTWASGGVVEISGGRYRLDVPNAAFAIATTLDIIGEASGKRIVHPLIDVGMDLSGTTVAGTGVLTEAYRATAQPGTLAQLLYEILAGILDHSITGTTKTTRKIDGSPAKTYTLNDSVNPTSITET